MALHARVCENSRNISFVSIDFNRRTINIGLSVLRERKNKDIQTEKSNYWENIECTSYSSISIVYTQNIVSSI